MIQLHPHGSEAIEEEGDEHDEQLGGCDPVGEERPVILNVLQLIHDATIPLSRSLELLISQDLTPCPDTICAICFVIIYHNQYSLDLLDVHFYQRKPQAQC